MNPIRKKKDQGKVQEAKTHVNQVSLKQIVFVSLPRRLLMNSEWSGLGHMTTSKQKLIAGHVILYHTEHNLGCVIVKDDLSEIVIGKQPCLPQGSN